VKAGHHDEGNFIRPAKERTNLKMALLGRAIPLVIGFIVLGGAFAVIERFWPSIRGQRRFRRGWRTDIAWFAFQPTIGKLFSGVIVFISIMSLGALVMSPISREQLQGLAPRNTWVTGLPAIVQIIGVIVIGDLLGYWQHRAFHTVGTLWRFHKIHHSSTNLDWLSSARVHPINDVVSNVIVALPILFLGFSPVAFAAYLPLLTLYAIMIHANVSWTYGPIGNIFASPTYHRWHHTSEEQGLDKNFAGLFPCIDRLFGTYYLPKGIQPQEFGVAGETIPDGFFAQMKYPFRCETPATAEQPPQGDALTA
jgi:sterol desaturase/sphingolipid hydroxylase (fatty acid hydroxylase superfamily)